MTPKEKAEDLFIRNYELIPDYVIKENKIAATLAILFALICVDEIIKSNPLNPANTDWDDCGGSAQYYFPKKNTDAELFWTEVKQEIEKL